MAMTVGQLRVYLDLDSSGYVKGLAQARDQGTAAERAFGGLGNAIADAARTGAVALGALTGATLAYSVANSQTYVRAVQFEQALEIVGRQMGISNDQIQEQIRGMTALGASNQNARDTVMQLMRARLDVTRATELYSRAEDIAVTTGKTGNEVIQGLIHGITTQNALVLRNAGVTIDANKAMSDYAASIGKSTSELSASEKQQAYFNAVMAETAGIAGVAQQQMAGLVFNWAAMQAPMQNLSETMGSLVEPALSAIGKALFNLVTAFNAATSAGGALRPIIDLIREAARAAGQPIADLINYVTAWLKSLDRTQVDAFAKSLKDWLPIIGAVAGALLAFSSDTIGKSLGPIGNLVPTINPVIGAFIGLLALDPRMRAMFTELVKQIAPLVYQLAVALMPILKVVTDLFIAVVRAILPMIPPLIQMATIIASFLVPVISALVTGLTWIFKAIEPLAPALGWLAGFLGTVGGALFLVSQATGWVTTAFGFVKNAIGGVTSAIGLLSNPVAWIIIAIAALAVGLYFAYQKSEPFRNAVNELWKALVTLWDTLSKAIKPAIDATGQAFEEIGKALEPAIEAVGRFLGWFLSAAAKEFTNTFTPAMKSLAKLLKDQLEPAFKDTSDAMNSFRDSLKVVEDAIKPMEPILKPLADLWGSFAGQILAATVIQMVVGPFVTTAYAIRGVASALKGLMDGLWWVAQFTKRVVEFFQWLYDMLLGGSIIPDLIDGIVRWFMALPSALAQIMAGIWNAIVSTWNSIWYSVAAIVTGIWQTISNVWNAIWSTLTYIATGIWNTLVSWWNNIWYSITSIANGIWTTLSNIWNSIWSTLTYIVTGIWNTLAMWWNNIWGTITSIVIGIWNTLATWWNNIWSTITAIVTGIWSTLATWWNIIWQTITAIVQGIWNTLWYWWSFIWTTITNIVTGIWQTLWTWFTNMWNTITEITVGIWNTLTSWWNWIGDFLYQKWEQIRSWAVEKFTAMRDQVTELLYNLRDNIANIMNTTASWFGERLQWIIDHINNFGKNVKAGLQAFGITLPDINIGPIQFARGGVVDRPTFAMVGEAGRESIIPWDPRRRKEATELWRKTGMALGMFGEMAGMGGPGGSLGTWFHVNAPMTQGPGGAFSHRGMQAWDYSMPNGTPLYLGLEGTVVPNPGGSGYGTNLGVNLDAGGSIILGHLTPGTINSGKHPVGTEIAKSDNTGFSTGPHLHFEVRGTHLSPGADGDGGGGFDLMGFLKGKFNEELKKWQDRAKVPVDGIMFGQGVADPGWATGWFTDIVSVKWIPKFFEWIMKNFGSKIRSLMSKAFGTDAWAGNGQFQEWAKEAMSRTGVGDDWLKGLDIIAKHESNYNPNAANNWDSNAARGDPSRGIMQTIGATFSAYALPDCRDIFNPVCNIAAAIRYIQARYGHVNNSPGVKAFLSGGRYTNYDRGGILPPGVGPVNASGRNEAVLSSGTFNRLLSVLDRLDQALGGSPTQNVTFENHYADTAVAQEVVSDVLVALRTL